MALKTPQNEAIAPAPVPSVFNDDLAYRCFPHRFRNIGNPFAYLNDVGITPIVEFICKGHLLIDVAEAVNVPLTTLRMWVEKEGHLEAIEEAETISAEGYLAEGMRRLRNAPTEFELRRAKEMIKHAQYMASKKNKPTYGDAKHDTGSAAGVTYIFNVPNSETAMKTVKAVGGEVIDSTANRIADDTATNTPTPVLPPVSMNLGQMFGVRDPTPLAQQTSAQPAAKPLADTKPKVAVVEDVPMPRSHFIERLQAQADKPTLPVVDSPNEPQLKLVADRPAKPTAKNPDIGPFFEEVTA